MKRILLAIILIMEVVIGVVLYFSFSEVYRTQEPRAPGQIQEPQPLVDQSIQSRSAVGQKAASQPSSQQASNNQTAQNTPDEPLSLSSSVLRYFEALPSNDDTNNREFTDELTTLGRALFYDQRLSVNETVSCNTCHLLDQYGVDNLALSLGFLGEPGKRNSPTVYNAALHVDQFWDGRSDTVEAQAKVPILSMVEMGYHSAADVEKAIEAVPGYRPYFEAAFPDDAEPVTFDNIATAIGAFERQLITPSRFDQFLAGDWNQFTPDELRGLGTFVEVGCTDCHQGQVIGGQLYKKLGLVEPYPTQDQGRYAITRAESDRYVFKVPSLRNIIETGPYLHDGSISSLPEMVQLMARHQLGTTLDAQQVNDIVSFLKTLTGDIPYNYIAKPVLP